MRTNFFSNFTRCNLAAVHVKILKKNFALHNLAEEILTTNFDINWHSQGILIFACFSTLSSVFAYWFDVTLQTQQWQYGDAFSPTLHEFSYYIQVVIAHMVVVLSCSFIYLGMVPNLFFININMCKLLWLRLLCFQPIKLCIDLNYPIILTNINLCRTRAPAKM